MGMATQICEHKACSCHVESGKRFCSDACRDLATAAAQSTGRCGCDHPECAAKNAAR